MEAGNEGLSVKKVARHVHNACNTFFATVSLEDVYNYVSFYLKSNSKSQGSIIERAGTRGGYRINLDSKDSRQLMLQFQEDDETEPTAKVVTDQSLELFDDV